MSLESKLANLSLGDESSVVEAIKAEGVLKSGFGANISALCAAIEGKDTDAAIAAMATVKAVAEGAPEAEAFTKECLSSCKFKFNRKTIQNYYKENLLIYIFVLLFRSFCRSCQEP